MSIYSKYAELVPYGDGFITQCPLCHAPTRSFSITGEVFSCAACRRAGDAVSLVMELEECSRAVAEDIVAEGAPTAPASADTSPEPGSEAKYVGVHYRSDKRHHGWGYELWHGGKRTAKSGFSTALKAAKDRDVLAKKYGCPMNFPEEGCVRAERRPKSSTYRGVYYNKSHKVWVYDILVNGKRITKAGFATEDEAARAREVIAVKHELFLNFPDTTTPAVTHSFGRKHEDRRFGKYGRKYADAVSHFGELSPAALTRTEYEQKSKHDGTAQKEILSNKRNERCASGNLVDQTSIEVPTNVSEKQFTQRVKSGRDAMARVFQGSDQKWSAEIVCQGVSWTQGSFDTEEDARIACHETVQRLRVRLTSGPTRSDPWRASAAPVSTSMLLPTCACGATLTSHQQKYCSKKCGTLARVRAFRVKQAPSTKTVFVPEPLPTSIAEVEQRIATATKAPKPQQSNGAKLLKKQISALALLITDKSSSSKTRFDAIALQAHLAEKLER